ncbi:MAG TPA: nuclear transport factor 2 family protein [Longimicrobium sp.]|nr:nuclear transport factor 2 family protein [Longimicrobium sp.]
MHRAILIVPLLFLAACAPAMPSSTPAPASASAPATWAADEASIAAALQGAADAWNRADMRGHLAMYVDSVTYMTANGPRPGLAPIEASFTRSLWRDGRPKQELRFEQTAIRPLGRDAALATGRFVLFGGGAPDAAGWFTLVWVRTAAGWRAVHDHSS